ncbi:hypothetical protein OHS33_33640 [Streptomyces sp. NBC_00536]|uniref:hypothetical protein n=1 Tax=Streptomyces sp. NBC_00536 TaxID=2975769 RepID=UPI002E81C84E|nr:hypothetical protein [Streptomyces sp. NBC_00536]WUC82873.1 hypothetical protein OHS33_33640 [Streptomyces sp. NBC_00536]
MSGETTESEETEETGEAGEAGEAEEAGASGGQPEPVWLVAANVVWWRRYGAGGQQLRRGTKSFRGGAKVYVMDSHWGPGSEQSTVIGRERNTGRWIVIDMATRNLHSFRPRYVHTPRVLERFHGSRRRPPWDQERAAQVAKALEEWAREYRAEGWRGSEHPERCLCHACLTGEPKVFVPAPAGEGGSASSG